MKEIQVGCGWHLAAFLPFIKRIGKYQVLYAKETVYVFARILESEELIIQ